MIKGSLAETAKAYTAEMLGVLVNIALDDDLPPGARSVAAQAVLDRGNGKPVQSTEHTGKDGKPIEHVIVTDRDRAKALAAFIAKTKARG